MEYYFHLSSISILSVFIICMRFYNGLRAFHIAATFQQNMHGTYIQQFDWKAFDNYQN